MTEPATTIAFIEDDDAFRALLEAVFGASARYRIVGSYASAEMALKELPRQNVDVIVVDVRLQGDCGIETVRTLRDLSPRSRCVVLTHSEEDRHLFEALTAGAAGYLLKTESNAGILAGVDELLAGGVPFSRVVARRVLGSFSKTKAPRAGDVAVTERERQILEQLASGHSSKEIAQALGISAATVKNHLYRIYEKLGVRSRTEAVLRWIERR